MPTRTNILNEGKSKIVYETDDPDLLIIHYKDDATAFNGLKKGTIADKGVFNCRISTALFGLLEKAGVPNHLVENLSERDQLVRRLRIVPIEFVVRNRIAGSLAKRYGLTDGPELSRPMLEFFVKDDDLGDPLIGREAIQILGLATAAELDEGGAYTMKVNEVLKAFFTELGISLVDFKLEFGVTSDGKLVLADEITPDGCRLWDAKTGEKMDKDLFRKDLGQVEETYSRVADLVGGALGA
jgi:phosphoribosylaminoimidazole-succinocarboxamide synthase